MVPCRAGGTLMLPRILTQELQSVQVWPFFCILTEPLTSKRLTLIWGWLVVLQGVGNQNGRVPRTLRGTEVLHKPLYLGNKNPGMLLYIYNGTNIQSKLTYGSLLPFLKTSMQKRKQALLLIFAINFENLCRQCKECLTGVVHWRPHLPGASLPLLSPNPHFREVILISRLSWWLSLLLPSTDRKGVDSPGPIHHTKAL